MTDELHNFFIRMQNSGNCLIAKDDVGKPKPACVSLPNEVHVYGKKTGKDIENVQDLIYAWKVSERTQGKDGEKDFRRLNKLGLKKKITRASQVREFRKNSPDVLITKRGRGVTPEVCFGQAARPSTPMKALLANFYGEVAAKDKHLQYEDEAKKVLSKNRISNKRRIIGRRLSIG